MNRLNPVQRFAALSGLCVVGLCLAMSFTISFLLEKLLLQSDWESTARLVRSELERDRLEPYFTEVQYRQEPARYQQAFQRLLRMPEVIRIKLWDREATVLWSDDSRLIGKRFPDNPEVKQALAGRVIGTLKTLGKAEQRYEREQFNQLAEVYVPVRGKEGIVGLVEVYKVPPRLFSEIRRMQVVVWGIAIVGSVLLYVVLLPIVRHSYRKRLDLEARLQAQAHDLEGLVQQRTRHLTHLNTLSQLVASSLDQQPVFDYIVRAATELIPDSVATLWIQDPASGLLARRAAKGVRHPELMPPPRLAPGEGLVGEAAATGKPVILRDVSEDPRRRSPDWARQEGFRTAAYIPLVREGRSLGVIGVMGRFDRAFAESEMELLTTLASQAAIAIENARLHEAALRRARQLALLNDLTRTLTTVLEPRAVAMEILAAAQRLIPGAAGRLWMRIAEDDSLRLVANIGLGDTEGGSRIRFLGGEGVIGIAAATRQPVVSHDVSTDPRFIDKAWAAAEGLVSSVAVPLMYGDRLEGALVIFTREPHEFDDEEVDLLRAFAAQATIALENARLYEAVGRHAVEMENRVKARTAELEAALRVKAEFLATMSHELRTPLNAVIGFAELLKQETPGPLNPKQARFVERIYAGGKHLLGLISDLLDLSLVEAGKSSLQPEAIPLAPLVQEAVDLFGVQVAQRRLEVTTALDPDIPVVVADRRKLAQILVNLVGNAVKFTPAEGRVSVTACQAPGVGAQEGGADCDLPTAATGEWIEIAVADTGIGIAPADLDRVFLGFQQLDSSEGRRYGGAGIGLALVKKLVELHGGRVWAESEGAGQGSRFIVRLPRLTATRAKRVLVVEDEAAVLETLCMGLETAGYVAERAENGAQALAAVTGGSPDLLVLDIGLPDIDGWEILKQVRSQEATRTLPVLVLTGLGDVHAWQAHTLGANEFLAKPVSIRILADTVTRLLSLERTGEQADGGTGDREREA